MINPKLVKIWKSHTNLLRMLEFRQYKFDVQRFDTFEDFLATLEDRNNIEKATSDLYFSAENRNEESVGIWFFSKEKINKDLFIYYINQMDELKHSKAIFVVPMEDEKKTNDKYTHTNPNIEVFTKELLVLFD